MRRVSVLAAAFSMLLSGLASGGDVWPRFRGPDGTGVVEGPKLPDRWSATENIAWKVPVPGRGWSSPIVVGNRIFLTTAVNSGTDIEAKKGLYFGGDRSKPQETEHTWKVLCLDLAHGSVVWEQTAHQGKPVTPLHVKNTYASETPITDGERIYAFFGNVGLFCYDLDGKPLWSKPVEPHRMRSGWGTAASPVLHGDRIYLVNDNDDKSYVMAIDKHTGDEVWKKDRDERSNWATPFVWKNSLRTELVTPGTGKTRSYDLEGNLLWEFGGMSVITIATPYAAGDLLYISSGYVLDAKKPLFAIRPGGTGDLTLPADKNANDAIVWCQKTAGPYNPTTLVYRDRLYVLYDMGLFACLDAKTGKEIYGGGNQKKRIPNGRAFTASPWAGDGKIYCLNEDGVTFVIKAGDDFEILNTNSLGDDEMAMATPAVVDDRLLIRTATQLYCIKRP